MTTVFFMATAFENILLQQLSYARKTIVGRNEKLLSLKFQSQQYFCNFVIQRSKAAEKFEALLETAIALAQKQKLSGLAHVLGRNLTDEQGIDDVDQAELQSGIATIIIAKHAFYI